MTGSLVLAGAGDLDLEVTDVKIPGGDTDGDLTPDDYETANGLNPNDPSDATSDLDGDGFTALFEYAMGTLADDSTNKPTFEIVHVSDTQAEITIGPITNGVT